MPLIPSRLRPRFRRFGESYQLRITSAADLKHIFVLDEAHWVASSAPIQTLLTDQRFLQYVDLDKDGRIRPFEMRSAVQWALDHLGDKAGLNAASDVLDKASIASSGPDSARLDESFDQVLELLQLSSGPIELSQVRAAIDSVQKGRVSEAGVVLARFADTTEEKTLIEALVGATGGLPHPSGECGVDGALVDRFEKSARDRLAWLALAEADSTTILPFGADTVAWSDGIEALDGKLEQFFAQSEALQVQPELAQRYMPDTEALDVADPVALAAFMEQAPLSEPQADGVLDLSAAINPVWEERLRAVRQGPWAAVLGDVDRIDRTAWRNLRAHLAGHRAWRALEPAAEFSELDQGTLADLLNPETLDGVRQLALHKERTALALGSIRLVEKLVLYQANLLRLANNYVSVSDLYDGERRALFDVGKLVLDGRHFGLGVLVSDRATHAKIASTSRICIIYVSVREKGVAPYEVAVAVTSGNRGSLFVGKRGLFKDTRGRELEAEITQIIDNPISFQEAVLAPFRRLAAAVGARIEAVTASAEKDLEATAGGAVDAVGDGKAAAEEAAKAAQVATAPTSSSSSSSSMGGSFAGGAVALAAMGSSMAFIAETVSSMGIASLMASLASALLAVIVPAMILALIRLSRRDLSALLEGAGWAINQRLILSFRQSQAFTYVPAHPEGSLGLPTRRRRAGRILQVLLLVALLWLLLDYLGFNVAGGFLGKD